MNDSIFSFLTLSASAQSLTQASTGSFIPENTSTEEHSFFDLFQRHSSVDSVNGGSRDVQSIIQSTSKLGVKTLPLPQSLADLDPDKSENSPPRVVDTITLSNSRLFQAVDVDKGQMVLGSGEFTPHFVDRVADGESQHDVEQQEFMKSSESGLSFDHRPQSGSTYVSLPLPVHEQRPSYGGSRQIAPQTMALPITPGTPGFEQGNMNPPTFSSTQGLPLVNSSQVQESGKLKESVLTSSSEESWHSPDGRKGQERIPASNSQIDELIEKGVESAPRRSINKSDQPFLPDQQKNHSMLPRTVSTVEPSVQLPALSIPAALQAQSVPGGSAIRPEAVGATIGGTGSIVTESHLDTGGSKQDLAKMQGAGETNGTTSDGSGEAGVQSGLGGFSHSQSGHQFSHAPSGQPAGGIRVPEEAAPQLPPQPVQRLQLDVQISETQRVQIDVGVQHRQVYAGLVMDHMALRNLALQFVPQLEEQFTNINLELSEFTAETPEEKGSEPDTTFQGRKPFSESQEGMGGGFPTQHGTLHRPLPVVEAGLHFVV